MLKKIKEEAIKRNNDIIESMSRQQICDAVWAHVSFLPSGCWVRLPLGKSFNPRVWVGPHRIGTHRIALFAATKNIPSNAWALHACGYSKCIRPSHLYWGSPKQNSNDRVKHARQQNNAKVLSTSLAGKYSDADIRDMWFKFYQQGWSTAAVAKEYICSHGFVGQILGRQRRQEATRDLCGNYAEQMKKRHKDGTLRSSDRRPDYHDTIYITDAKVIEIRNMLNEGHHSADVAFALDIPFATVLNIFKNSTYKHVPGKVDHLRLGRGAYASKGRPKGSIGRLNWANKQGVCSIADFDTLLIKIWMMYHKLGLSVVAISRETKKPRRFVGNVLKKKWRRLTMQRLPTRGGPAMFGKKEVGPKDARAILSLHLQGETQASLAKKFNTNRKMVADIIYAKKFASATRDVPRLDPGKKRRVRIGRLSEHDVRSIRDRHRAGESAVSLSKKFSVVTRSIYAVVHKKIYQWVDE